MKDPHSLCDSILHRNGTTPSQFPDRTAGVCMEENWLVFHTLAKCSQLEGTLLPADPVFQKHPFLPFPTSCRQQF